MKPFFIVTEFRKDLQQQWYVVARPGYMRCKDGTYARDGSFNGGPEWSTNPAHAFKFATHRAAARVRNRCSSYTKIIEMPCYI